MSDDDAVWLYELHTVEEDEDGNPKEIMRRYRGTVEIETIYGHVMLPNGADWEPMPNFLDDEDRDEPD